MFKKRKKIPDKYPGMQFMFGNDQLVFTICESELPDHYDIIWISDDTSEKQTATYKQADVRKNITNNIWNKI